MNAKFEKLGMKPADILLPRDCDMSRWAVVACDQFTSQPEYWDEVDRIAGDAPSTLRLILPESKLNDADVEEHIADINRAMADYLARDIFKTYQDAIIYIERSQSDGEIRHGLVAAVDLEQYDYTPGSGSLIRATEGTVLERIPPRVRVRKDAPIELPHVMLLIDDPDKTCIEPITAAAGSMEPVYDFELMMKGGHLKGWLLSEDQQNALADATIRFAPAVIAGLVLAAIVAATMSSASGNMIGTATMFTNDVFRPYINKGVKDDKKEVWISRVTMVIVGLIGLAVALTASNIISVMMGAFALRSAGPFAAFICGLFYKNVTKRAGFISIVLGTVVAAIWIYGLNTPWGLSAIVPGGVVAFIAIFVLSAIDRKLGVEPAPELVFDND